MQSHLQGHLPMSHKNPSFLAPLYAEALESSSASGVAPLLMHGFPAEPEHRVTWHNWMRPPFSQWGFRNLARLRPTIDVPAGPGPGGTLKQAPHALDQAGFGRGGGGSVRGFAPPAAPP